MKSWAWLPKFCGTFGVLCEGSSAGSLQWELCNGDGVSSTRAFLTKGSDSSVDSLGAGTVGFAALEPLLAGDFGHQ